MDKIKCDKFANCVNDLKDFESVYSVTKSDDNIHSLEVQRVEVNSLWDQVKRAYLDCRDHVQAESEKPIDKTKLRSHYSEALGCYKRVLSSLNEEIFTLSEQRVSKKSSNNSENREETSESNFAPITRLPPCDTDTFRGGYNNWPTFRDLFKAIYIDNSRLSNVEKLFHLSQKTAGEARELISHVPLTNDGFALAWKNLSDRYENTRMQVNEQIKILFNLPVVTVDSSSSIQKLQRTINGCIKTLETLRISVTDWDPILIYLCSTKLPRAFLEDFENSLDDCSEIPTWKEFDNFLTQKFKTLESVGNIRPSTSKNNIRNDLNKKEKYVNTFQTNVAPKAQYLGGRNKLSTKPQTQNKNHNENNCPICKTNHFIRDCKNFLEKSVNDRIHLVKISHLCYNCLSSNHGVKECKSKFNCRNCNLRHHSLLHKGVATQATKQDPANNEVRPSTSAAALTTSIQSTQETEATNVTTLTLRKNNLSIPNPGGTLLFTAVVQIESHGNLYDARAIIDPGSQSTFISEKLKNRLSLPTKPSLVHVCGVSQVVSETSTKSCLFTLRSRIDPRFELEVWAPVLKTLPSNLPPKTLDTTQLRETSNLELADPEFYSSQPIDVLIGMDIGPLIFSYGSPIKSLGTLIAQKTVFGWIIGGTVSQGSRNDNRVILYNTVSIEEILTRFWEVEEPPKKILRSAGDTYCEKHFRETTRRLRNGRYVVTLPFKNCEELGNSRNLAMAQFYRMEKRLLRTPEIKEQYDQTILEYLKLGHMRKVMPQEISKTPHYYLPHHAVIKPEKLTTKLRVVFNASSPTSNGRSLNDNLYPGPILQQDLVIQILKWRFFKYVFNADVTKMYRQILLDTSQTQYQRILFRNSPNDPIEDFELLTVTFGVNCAPFLAIRTLLQLAEDLKDSYPLASKIIRENLYVDDVLAGGHTIQEAVRSRDELIEAMDSAGFKLMKWSSNEPQIIQDLPQEKLLPVKWLDISEDSSTKTLGIRWNISGDYFTFTQPSIENKVSYSKREVLSTIAKLFDPCGWLAPIIVVAKLIMQQVWLDKINWDDPLKSVALISWQTFVKNSLSIESVKIPRWVQFTTSCYIELHGFCDASERAYAATLYLRVVHSNNNVDTFLISAKTRVAPIKKVSLPRLELCGAVLLSTLTSSVIASLPSDNLSRHYWTDSTIVLAWLKKPPCSWNTFVGNRVSEILEKVGTDNWYHVDSDSNPADIASRGCSPEELIEHPLWWHGPKWLRWPKTRWPTQGITEDTNLEAKAVKVLTTTTFEDPLNRYSSLAKAYRVLAYVLRLWRNTGRNRTNLRISCEEITMEEIQDVKTRLIVLTQRHFFAKEYHSLKKQSAISMNSNLISLNPFLDPKGVMRANGRLSQSPALTYNERHPILLPYDSKLTELLVEFTHKVTIHGGNQLMTRVLRAEFWIFRLKPLVKKVIHRCKICLICKQKTQTQIMAALPPERTQLSRPFTNTGVDFAGPFNIKSFSGRACVVTKGYVCVFVCFATKAIHLEVTSDLSTQSFLAAFTRFIGRRGCPSCMYSDNGTNFVGAAEMLRKDCMEFMKAVKTTIVQQHIHQSLDWKFIPPGAPHMGGLWEAGVKSFKTHLRKFMPKMNFTFEEFSTILIRIEACLNSRPLSIASDDPNDLSPLTPGHFLIGTSMLAPPEPDISDQDITLVNRWKRLKIISQYFCQRWKVEYLKDLHRRNKWKYPQSNLKVGDLVVIKDERYSPNDWKMGRVEKTYEGTDHNVRVVDIKTISGIVSRPITKIVKLFSD